MVVGGSIFKIYIWLSAGQVILWLAVCFRCIPACVDVRAAPLSCQLQSKIVKQISHRFVTRVIFVPKHFSPAVYPKAFVIDRRANV
jgi:hypothetical protein